MLICFAEDATAASDNGTYVLTVGVNSNSFASVKIKAAISSSTERESFVQ